MGALQFDCLEGITPRSNSFNQSNFTFNKNVNIPSNTIPKSIQTTIPTQCRFELLILAQLEPVSQWSIEKVSTWIENLSNEKGIEGVENLKTNLGLQCFT